MDMQEDNCLTENELKIIQKVQAYAVENEKNAKRIINALIRRYSIAEWETDNVIDAIFCQKRATINFHPDLITGEGLLVAEKLLHEGEYYSQFVTKNSNGYHSIPFDNLREKWETNIFGTDVSLADFEHPKYAGLNIFSYLEGAFPRYGSCYLQLREEIWTRCTFLIADKEEKMKRVGTRESFYIILLTMLTEIIKKKEVLGRSCANIMDFYQYLKNCEVKSLGKNVSQFGIEAHVFGNVDLSRDVESIYIDESFAKTKIHELFLEISKKYKIGINWIPERRCSFEEVVESLTDPKFVTLLNTFKSEYEISLLTPKILADIRKYIYGNRKRWAIDEDYRYWNRCIKDLWTQMV